MAGELTNLRHLRLGNLPEDHHAKTSDDNDNQSSGPIPPELGSLVKLEVLYLGNLRLSGPIPSELGSLVKLNGWRLAGNEDLEGCIPAIWGRAGYNDFDEAGREYCTD